MHVNHLYSAQIEDIIHMMKTVRVKWTWLMTESLGLMLAKISDIEALAKVS